MIRCGKLFVVAFGGVDESGDRPDEVGASKNDFSRTDAVSYSGGRGFEGWLRGHGIPVPGVRATIDQLSALGFNYLP